MDIYATGQAGVMSIHYIPLILGIAVTLVQCFFGFKLFRYIMGFWGFALFGYVGYTIGNAFGNQTATLTVCFILGAIGAFIAYKFYKAGVFLQGLIAGFIIGAVIALYAGLATGTAFAAGIVLGILLGLLTAYILKPLIILTSAVSGGMASGAAIAGLLNFPRNAGLFIGMIFMILGIGYQFYSIGKDKGLKHKKDKEDKKKKGDAATEQAEDTIETAEPEAAAVEPDAVIAEPEAAAETPEDVPAPDEAADETGDVTPPSE